MMIFSKLLLSTLVVLQVIGPAWIVTLHPSEALAQESSDSQARIAGLRGIVTVTPTTTGKLGYFPEYKSPLSAGDVITTEEESIAELLLDNQGLLTIQEYSEAILGQEADGRFSLNLQVGAVEWSLPQKTQTSLTVSTPNIRATTDGGLITAEVQPTLGDVAQDSLPRKPLLVRTKLQAQSTPPVKVSLVETFCAKEGTLQLEYPGPEVGTQDLKYVPDGQCAGFYNGSLRAMGDEYQIADWRAICAVGPHCEIPEPTKKQIKKKQMGQALALERALVGPDKDNPDANEQVVLATTGTSLAASIDGTGNGLVLDQNGNPILPTTGVEDLTPGGGPGPGGQGPGGGGLPLTPGAIPGSVTGPPFAGLSPPPVGSGNASGNIQQKALLAPGIEMAGGLGLLTFVEGDFTADKELLIADSGLLATASHKGKAPQDSLLVMDLSPNGQGSPSNQKLPLELGHLPITAPGFNQVKNSNVQLGTDDMNRGDRVSRFNQLEQLAQFARSPSIDPNNLIASLPDPSSKFPCMISEGSCLGIILAAGLGGLETPIRPDPGAGVDASIQVRSASTADPTPGDNRQVTLRSGVVLGDNTLVALALQEKTNNSFTGLESTLGQAIQASAVSVIGEPGEPALLNVEDRILAILSGSRIQPANTTVTTALVTVLDGTLRGPTVPSVIGKDSVGVDIIRSDVSPLIEIIDGRADVATGLMVGSTATSAQTDVLDQALLEATSPIVAMIRGTVNTSSDFARVAGQNAKLTANLPGDALVQLNASSLMVNGNLFNVTGGGQLIVNGDILSLQGNSSVNIAGGVFVNVGAGSSFSLTNGALVNFGTGTNMVTVTNSLCAGGGGCFAPFANPGWQVAGSPTDFSAPDGFNPFVDLGTFADGSVNTLTVGQDAAILSVAPGGSIQIQ